MYTIISNYLLLGRLRTKDHSKQHKSEKNETLKLNVDNKTVEMPQTLEKKYQTLNEDKIPTATSTAKIFVKNTIKVEVEKVDARKTTKQVYAKGTKTRSVQQTQTFVGSESTATWQSRQFGEFSTSTTPTNPNPKLLNSICDLSRNNIITGEVRD